MTYERKHAKQRADDATLPVRLCTRCDSVASKMSVLCADCNQRYSELVKSGASADTCSDFLANRKPKHQPQCRFPETPCECIDY